MTKKKKYVGAIFCGCKRTGKSAGEAEGYYGGECYCSIKGKFKRVSGVRISKRLPGILDSA